MKKVCKYCGKEYLCPSNSGKEFCGIICSYNTRRKTPKMCQQCGVVLSTKKRRQRFCSAKCMGTAKSGKYPQNIPISYLKKLKSTTKIVMCCVCGKPFPKIKSRRGSKSHYCSDGCHWKEFREQTDFNKHCLTCGKKIERRKGESLWELRRNKFCSRRCAGLMGLRRASELGVYERLWNDKEITNKFKEIKNNNKYNSRWLRINNKDIYCQIRRRFDKNAFGRFLYSIGEDGKLINDRIIPRHKRMARKFIKYWKEELGLQRGRAFSFCYDSDLPIDEYVGMHPDNPQDAWQFWNARKYMVDKGIIRLYKRGHGKRSGTAARESEYILLKTRI